MLEPTHNRQKWNAFRQFVKHIIDTDQTILFTCLQECRQYDKQLNANK